MCIYIFLSLLFQVFGVGQNMYLNNYTLLVFYIAHFKISVYQSQLFDIMIIYYFSVIDHFNDMIVQTHQHFFEYMIPINMPINITTEPMYIKNFFYKLHFKEFILCLE